MFTSNSFKLGLLFILGLLLTPNLSKAAVGEPVPGAEILIEQEPNDVPIARCTTNDKGEFTFSFPKGAKVPKSGVLTITITSIKITPKDTNKTNKLALVGKQKIKIKFNTEKGQTETFNTSVSNMEEYKINPSKSGPLFKFYLKWTPPDPKIKSTTQNRGSFAVSGKSDT